MNKERYKEKMESNVKSVNKEMNANTNEDKTKIK